MMEIWTESANFYITQQRLVDRIRLIENKCKLSDPERLEIYGQINREEPAQRELPKLIEA